MKCRGITSIGGTCLATALCLLGATAPAALAAGPNAAATKLGSVAPGRQMQLVLPLTADEAGLERLASAVNTVGSPQYGQFESLSTLAQRFGASPSVRARVVSYLRRAGATGVKVDATGLFADATMSASAARRLFGTSLARYHSAREGRYIAPTGSARIPAGLRGAVSGVVGLDTRPLFAAPQTVVSHGHFQPSPATVSHNNVVSGYAERSGTPSGCGPAVASAGFTPNQYLTAYGYSPLHDFGVMGQGERVALIEIDGFRFSDLKAFAACYGLSVPRIQGYGVGVSKPLPPGGESTLDLEVLDAAAPKLKEIDVYESHSRAADVLRSLTAPLQNHGKTPQVISASLGTCEPALVESIGYSGVRAVEGALAAAAASGISVLASSGDDGSTACIGRDGPIDLLSVSYPASSPFVTGVGGTNLALDANNAITNQIVWNDAPVDLAASGGGLSGLFERPKYQRGFVPVNRRVVPDVSMLADVQPGYDIYCTVKECADPGHASHWVSVGGTSAAAPLFAGGLALTDQVLRHHRRQELGVANSLLYFIAHSPDAGSVFSDVVANDNDLSAYLGDHAALGCCSAGTGFDYASGLGSVNLSQLVNLAGQVQPPIASVGVSLPRQRPVAKRRLLAKLSCSTRCVVAAYARISVGRARPFKVRSAASVFKRKNHKTVKLKLSKSNLARIRRGLRGHKKVVARVFGVIMDSGGNVERTSLGRTLRIRH
ncbi:MAG TPA: S53 family peptidase [Solirubrobacteraceae bacterium]|jgi:kumamolisin